MQYLILNLLIYYLVYYALNISFKAPDHYVVMISKTRRQSIKFLIPVINLIELTSI